MLDPSTMYPHSFHPARPDMRRDYKGRAKYFTRTERPPKYYLIDFGLSITFNPEDGPPRAEPVKGGDKTLPEIEDHPNDDYDPFPADVYYLGNWVKEWFMKKYYGFDFMQPLVKDMVERDPRKRPTMEQVIPRLDKIVQSLSSWKLRSRVSKRSENVVLGMFRSAGHWKRQVVFSTSSLPAIPVPPTSSSSCQAIAAGSGTPSVLH